jgi:hypothetical protein
MRQPDGAEPALEAQVRGARDRVRRVGGYLAAREHDRNPHGTWPAPPATPIADAAIVSVASAPLSTRAKKFGTAARCTVTRIAFALGSLTFVGVNEPLGNCHLPVWFTTMSAAVTIWPLTLCWSA